MIGTTSTKLRLAAFIRETYPGIAAAEEMAQLAERGWYDSFESELAMPQLQLIIDAEKNGFHELTARVKNDEFGGTAAEGDAWWEREGPEIAADMGVTTEQLDQFLASDSGFQHVGEAAQSVLDQALATLSPSGKTVH